MDRYTFRGKSIDTDEWIIGNIVMYADLAQIWADREDGKWNYIVDPATVGQFSGFMDKNGTPVYEGDIVSRKAAIYELGKGAPVGEYQAIGKVCVQMDGDEPPYWVVKSHDNNGSETDMVLFVKTSGWNDGWYVIGNIHDNPELLA